MSSPFTVFREGRGEIMISIYDFMYRDYQHDGCRNENKEHNDHSTFRFSFWHFSLASEVMNDMNSDTHSCTVSLASFAIFAFLLQHR